MYLIEFDFPASKSLAHPRSLEIARQSPHFACQEIDGQRLYHTAFDLYDFAQANLALEISQLLQGLRGVSIRHAGKTAPQSFGLYIWLPDILKCYVQSMSSSDYRAHCWKIISITIPGNVAEIKVSAERSRPRREFSSKEVSICYPCVHALYTNKKIDLLHPANIKDQLKSFAIKACIDWCPAFNLMAAIEETEKLMHSNVLLDMNNVEPPQDAT